MKIRLHHSRSKEEAGRGGCRREKDKWMQVSSHLLDHGTRAPTYPEKEARAAAKVLEFSY